jgi:MFS family permease
MSEEKITAGHGSPQSEFSTLRDPGLPPSPSQDGPDEDPALRASVLRKYDCRILPITFLSWTIFYLDRAAISLAYVNGMREDLDLHGTRYNTTLLIFFLLYIALTIPGNLLLRRAGGGRFLPLVMAAWGLVTTFTGFVKTFEGLCVARVFLGLAESAYLGSVMLYLGFFYTEFELVARVGIFYSGNAFAGAIGGFLAGGLSQITFRGYNGWPWIYFVEGILTVLLAAVAFAVLPDTPETAKFLSREERILAVERMLRLDRRHEELITGVAAPSDPEREGLPDKHAKTRGRVDVEGRAVARPDRLRWRTFKGAVWNPVAMMLALACWLCIAALYSFSFFLPIIIKAMGYSGVKLNLMTVPPWMAAFIFTILISQYCQHSGRRAYPIMGCAVVATLGYVLLLAGAFAPTHAQMTRIQYSGTFFVAVGTTAMAPLCLAWTSINASPHYIRAIVLGFITSVGNTAAFLASYSYIPTKGPR